MENIKANSRLNYKGNAVKFKDDDYETPKKVLQDLIPFISQDKIIYDPFYCDGYVKTEWKDLGYECINNKVDAYIPVKFDFDIIITNPNGRYNFYKKDKENKGSWFDTMWLCYNMNLDNTIIKL